MTKVMNARIGGHCLATQANRRRVISRVLFLLLLFSTPATYHLAYGQTTNATLSGTVMDPQGRVVPGVDVNITNMDTNISHDTKTNGDGIYVAPNLQPGRYRVSVMKQGFKSITLTDVVLHVQDTVSSNFNLELGAASESITVGAADPTSQGITVYGEAENINTTDATVSTTIDRNFAENLPLNGRSFQMLILLTPGTVLVPASNNGGQFSINGQRTNGNSFTVDGVSANGGAELQQGTTGWQFNGANPSLTINGTTQGMVSVDALQEFKIQTSTYAPEFGRQPGGQVSLLTRSGANAFHGTAFDYFRNTVLDANTWFNDQRGLPKGVDRQNDFGGTFGGPIFKDKTFFFFSYEGLRLYQPVGGENPVPSLALRQEAAPAFQPFINSFPLPDPGGNGSTYTLSSSLPHNMNAYAIKIDHNLGKSMRLFGRYSDATSNTLDVISIAETLQQQVRARSLTIGTDTSIRPNLVNEVRLNYSVTVSKQAHGLLSVDKSFDASVLYPSPLVFGRDSASWVLSLPTGSYSTEPATFGKYPQRQINVLDNVTYTLGTHQLKWGMDYRRDFPILAQVPLQVSYTITSENDLKNGIASQVQIGHNLVTHPIYDNWSLYAQDTWRASPRLTLTYGIRWELNPTPGERDGFYPPNVIGLDNPATATLAPAGPLYKTTYNNFAPRIGIAYQVRHAPGHETVLRAGFGVFYDLNSETFADGLGEIENVSAVSNSVPFPVAANFLPPVPPVPIPLTPPFNKINAIDPNLKLPYSLQWNVSVEQGLGRNQTITASYVASAGERLLRTDQLYRFNSSFKNVNVLRNASSSNYQSLQLQYNRRLSQGLQALASYTYSHSIDNSSDGSSLGTASVSGTTFLNPNIDRGNSSFDQRHAFRGAITYNIPTWNENFLSKAVLGGWSVDTIGIAQTGLPVNLQGGFDFVNGELIRLRPNIVPGQPLYLYGAQCALVQGTPCPGGWGFNPNAFVPVPKDSSGAPTQLEGTLGRNAMHGFGSWQIDLALHRQFNLTERVNLQFRSEFFNVLNHPNFGGIDSFLPDGPGAFGLAQGILGGSYGTNALYSIGGPRSVQLALKLSF